MKMIGVLGEFVVDLIADRATIQHGPGTISEAVLLALDRPVRVWSGIVSDALVDLSERGLLVDQATAAYLWGGPRLKNSRPAERSGSVALRKHTMLEYWAPSTGSWR